MAVFVTIQGAPKPKHEATLLPLTETSDECIVYSSTPRSGVNRYSRGTKWGFGKGAASPSRQPGGLRGMYCKLSSLRGLGRSPSRNRVWCIFTLKSHNRWQQF